MSKIRCTPIARGARGFRAGLGCRSDLLPCRPAIVASGLRQPIEELQGIPAPRMKMNLSERQKKTPYIIVTMLQGKAWDLVDDLEIIDLEDEIDFK